MRAHTHSTVLIRKHEGKAHLYHDQQRMEIPHDNGRIFLLSALLTFRGKNRDFATVIFFQTVSLHQGKKHVMLEAGGDRYG